MKLDRYDYHATGDNCAPKRAGRGCCGDCYDCFYGDLLNLQDGEDFPVPTGPVQAEFDFGLKFKLKPQLNRGCLST